MKVNLKLTDPDEYAATLTVIATVGELRRIEKWMRHFLRNSSFDSHAAHFANALDVVIKKADSAFATEETGAGA